VTAVSGTTPSLPEEIVRLAARGDGVTGGGRFVAGTAPGDIVEADGAILRGPHHVVPPCRHFGSCGGCQLQHVDDAAYADFVTDRIAGALTEHGFARPEFLPVHLSPPHTRRRASLKVERRGRELLIGFNAAASHRIVDMRECPVLRRDLFALIAPLRRLLAQVLPDRTRGNATLTAADQGIDLLLSGFAADSYATIEALNDFAAAHRLARLSLDEGEGPSPRWMPQPPTVTLSGVAVPLPEAAFLQATADGEAALVAAVGRAVAGAARTADLFAGLGTFALSLPGQLTAVEGSRAAIDALKSTARVTALHRDLFRQPLLTAELAAFDAVVLDPPRAGAREQIAQLAASRVPRIAYVSCNPATFARDARVLVDGGYRLHWILPVGQFRWSTHVELCASFTR